MAGDFVDTPSVLLKPGSARRLHADAWHCGTRDGAIEFIMAKAPGFRGAASIFRPTIAKMEAQHAGNRRRSTLGGQVVSVPHMVAMNVNSQLRECQANLRRAQDIANYGDMHVLSDGVVGDDCVDSIYVEPGLVFVVLRFV